MNKISVAKVLIPLGIMSYFFEFKVPENFTVEDIGENRFGVILILTGIFEIILYKRKEIKRNKIDNK